MSESHRLPEESVWRNGYNFALLLLVILGVSSIVIGTALFPQGTLPNVVFVGTGISIAPAAIIAALFRFFLFKEVRYQLTAPVLDEVRDRLGPEIKGQVEQIIQQYRQEIATLQALQEAGVISPHRHREQALKDFASAIDAETSEITVIGSSLKGLLQKEEYREIAQKLQFKIQTGGVRVRFLLTHPVVADLRAGQEARRPGEIGAEIIQSLRVLKDWGTRPENVRLYKGTPTCFAIKTGRQMLLNPYPYTAVSFDSPCLTVTTSEDHPSYFYDAFSKSHFGAWDTTASTRIYDFDQSIAELQNKLETYSQMVQELLMA